MARRRGHTPKLQSALTFRVCDKKNVQRCTRSSACVMSPKPHLLLSTWEIRSVLPLARVSQLLEPDRGAGRCIAVHPAHAQN